MPATTPDDVVYRFRLRTPALAGELGSVRAACRATDVRRSTCCRWKSQADRYGPGILRPRERRRPQMPDSISPLVGQRIPAFSIGSPGLGPAGVSAELARPKRGGLKVSPSGAWRVLRRRGLSTGSGRLALAAGCAAPPGPQRPDPQPERRLDADRPGQPVQMDCLRIGRLSGSRGTLRQYAAIDAASSCVRAELHAGPRNPASGRTLRPARRAARDLSSRGRKLEAVTTDSGS